MLGGVVDSAKVTDKTAQLLNMSEAHFDEYEHFNYDYDKHIFTGHSGKQRSKREAVMHTNHFDPCGHSRKILTKLVNTEHKKRETKSKS